MPDLASAAREFVGALECANVDAYADSLGEWVLDWVRRGEWPRFAGPSRQVVEVVTDERWPTRAAVVMDGGDRTMALRVHFDAAGKVSGFGWADGRFPMLGFQHVPGYIAPRWQDPEYPSQIHLDFHFEDHDDAIARAEGLGAIQLPDGGSCPVYADSAGHPFCLCSPGS